MAKDTQINIRISTALKTAAEKAASTDERSLSSLIAKLLVDYCQEHGFLKPERKIMKARR